MTRGVSQQVNTVGSAQPFAQAILEDMLGLLKKQPPREVLRRIEEGITNRGLDGAGRAKLKFLLGLEMEKRDHQDMALQLYEAALDMEPDNSVIQGQRNSLLASLSSGSRYDYLLNTGRISAQQVEKAMAISQITKRSTEFVLTHQFGIKKEDIGKSLSLFHGCPFRAFDPGLPVPVELIGKLKKSFLLHDLWVPLSWEKTRVEILLDNPADLRKTDQIKGLIKARQIVLSVGIKEDIEQFIIHFFDNKPNVSVDDMVHELDTIPDITFDEEEDDVAEEYDIHDESSSQVVRLVDQIIVTAQRKRASDIHIEPSSVSRTTTIRFRLDGVCQEYLQVPSSMTRGIISRLKIMANMDISERRLPQDGKIKFRRKGIPPFELRIATLPTTGGNEDAVLRILAESGKMPLEEMGLNERNINLVRKIVSKPYGLFLVVGPTGSGKTTTLHAALGYINKPGVKIWTAEDPVEITQDGLRQVEVKPKIGLDFPRVMRSFLRADPDVIMIGEMRDYETASIGIEASLTGHLVFSTLHTNSAPETVTRLLDMGLNPLNFSDAFLGVLAQRLVRRLCSKCRRPYTPTPEGFEDLVHDYGKEAFHATGIEYTKQFVLYRPKGCEACSGTGYYGRMGIHELMLGTPQIKRLIKKQAPTEDLFVQAFRDGMNTLKQDGMHKVFQGLTDVDEVRRVCID
jgi:type II secretory ATPase GspE/PulE/Tfp pilus assembly ATPase PilB-like protein